jgi:hypothetical protein
LRIEQLTDVNAITCAECQSSFWAMGYRSLCFGSLSIALDQKNGA